ncbi:GNAT family N-acetyltransferase [Streptomyces sp. NPDC053720]|uniref:GNAT family N-acetyltransferase n=1 Tax=Streptomyces sp. NPDC053720 TaxID=3154855 RepID=UPI003438E2B3
MARSETRTLTNADPDFYPLMGPYLSNRAVVKSLGGPVWDDPGKTWIVLLASGQVTGFIAVTDHGHIESLYTAPGHHDLRTALVKAAVEQAGDRPLTAVVSHSRAGHYKAAGFAETRHTVNFTTLHRPSRETAS